MPDSFSDDHVVKMVLKGQVNEFERLVVKYEGFIKQIVAPKVPHDDMQEVVHLAFVRAFKSLAGFEGRKPFKHWLSKIAVRTCYDFWRERYRNHEIPESVLSNNQQEWLQNLASSQDDPSLEATERYEARELLEIVLGRLSAGDRMVLLLTHMEGYSTAEAAEMLGWSMANVKVRAFRARATLRKSITKLLEMGTEPNEKK